MAARSYWSMVFASLEDVEDYFLLPVYIALLLGALPGNAFVACT